jgi:dihydrodipicolinate synthase/N-acetylneuraminate lyase
LLAGTTGEGPLLEDDEVVAVVRCAARAAEGRVALVAQVGRPSTRATLALARRAVEAGATVLAAVVPYYFKVDGPRLRAHYVALLDAELGVPVLAYTIPQHTGNELEPEDLELLVAAGLAGVKDSTKSLARHAAYAEAIGHARPDGPIALVNGSDPMLVAARRAGGTGSMTAMANVVPHVIAALQAAADAGRWEDAEDEQERLNAARASLRPGGTAAAVKAAIAAELTDVDYPTGVRAPL